MTENALELPELNLIYCSLGHMTQEYNVFLCLGYIRDDAIGYKGGYYRW